MGNSIRNGAETQEKYGVAISRQQSAISSQLHKVGAVCNRTESENYAYLSRTRWRGF